MAKGNQGRGDQNTVLRVREFHFSSHSGHKGATMGKLFNPSESDNMMYVYIA